MTTERSVRVVENGMFIFKSFKSQDLVVWMKITKPIVVPFPKEFVAKELPIVARMGLGKRLTNFDQIRANLH